MPAALLDERHRSRGPSCPTSSPCPLLQRDGSNNARPLGVGRNTGEGFDFSSVDLRLMSKFVFTERWNLDVLAESCNRFNRVNLLAPNGTMTSASFAQATNAADLRQIQFGMRLNF